MTVSKLIAEIWWKLRWSSKATSFCHFLAMNAPFNSWRLFFYRRRGVRIGRGVYIVQGCFLEESRPWLIEIGDNVRIGANVTIVTHDAVYFPDVPYKYGKVVLKENCTVCPGAIILPGVTVGERAIVAPGCLVVKDVPPRTVVGGVPACEMMSVDDGIERNNKFAARYEEIADSTKYPWKLKKKD